MHSMDCTCGVRRQRLPNSGRHEGEAAGPLLRQNNIPDKLDMGIYPARNAQSAYDAVGPGRSCRIPRGRLGIVDQCPSFASFFFLRRLLLLKLKN